MLAATLRRGFTRDLTRGLTRGLTRNSTVSCRRSDVFKSRSQTCHRRFSTKKPDEKKASGAPYHEYYAKLFADQSRQAEDNIMNRLRLKDKRKFRIIGGVITSVTFAGIYFSNILTSAVANKASEAAKEALDSEQLKTSTKIFVDEIVEYVTKDEKNVDQLIELLCGLTSDPKVQSDIRDLLWRLTLREDVKQDLLNLIYGLLEDPTIQVKVTELLKGYVLYLFQDEEVIKQAGTFLRRAAKYAFSDLPVIGRWL